MIENHIPVRAVLTREVQYVALRNIRVIASCPCVVAVHGGVGKHKDSLRCRSAQAFWHRMLLAGIWLPPMREGKASAVHR